MKDNERQMLAQFLSSKFLKVSISQLRGTKAIINFIGNSSVEVVRISDGYKSSVPLRFPTLYGYLSFHDLI